MTLWSCKVNKEDNVGAGPQKVALWLSLGCSIQSWGYAICRWHPSAPYPEPQPIPSLTLDNFASGLDTSYALSAEEVR